MLWKADSRPGQPHTLSHLEFLSYLVRVLVSDRVDVYDVDILSDSIWCVYNILLASSTIPNGCWIQVSAFLKSNNA